MIYTYIDETEFKIKNDKILGAGCFCSIQEVQKNLIDTALNELEKLCSSNHPESNNAKRTLRRGFFHAANDCDLTRRTLANTISKNLHGSFEVFFASDNKIKEFHPTSNMRNHHRQQQMAVLATFAESVHFNKPVNIYIEEAPKQIIKQQSFWDNAWIEQLHSAINQPMSPHYFPKLETFFVDKTNPGTQVTDLLLWCCQRKYVHETDHGILEQCGLRKRLSLPYENTPIFYDSYGIGHKIKNKKSYHKDLNAFQIKNSKNKIEDLITADQLAIDIIIKLSKSDPFPENINHFKNKIMSAAIRIKEDPYKIENLQSRRELYIIIFDTLPIYPDYNLDNSNKIKELLKNKLAIASAFKY